MRLGPNALDSESVLVALQLIEETRSHFEIRSARVQKLKSFVQTPLVAAHEKSGNDETGSVLRLDRLNEDTLVIVDGFFHELVDLLGDLLCGVEQRLLLVVLPVERQVEHSNCLPEVAKLCPCRVDHSSDLVGDDEFQILNSSAEQVVKFDSNCSTATLIMPLQISCSKYAFSARQIWARNSIDRALSIEIRVHRV